MDYTLTSTSESIRVNEGDNIYKILAADNTVGDTLMPDSSIDTTPVDSDADADTTNLVIDNKTVSPVTLGENTETVDASKRTKPVRIIGNDLANLIVSGSGNDTLDGADSDDTLTGGKGNDLFIYNGGDDLITDYESKDKISVASANLDFEINGTDLIFDFGNNDSLTIADGASIAVNINSTINYYTADGIVNGKQKGISLAADIEKSLDASKSKLYSKLVTINGSAVEEDIQIIGNNKANKIYAGSNGATLNGGKGKDTIYGGDGADTFIFKAGDGNDTIIDYKYSDGDLLQILDKRGKEIAPDRAIKKWTYNGDDLTLTIKGGGKLVLEGVGRSAKVKFSNDSEQKF